MPFLADILDIVVMTPGPNSTDRPRTEWGYRRIYVTGDSPDLTSVVAALKRALSTSTSESVRERAELQVIGVDRETVQIRIGAPTEEILSTLLSGLPDGYRIEHIDNGLRQELESLLDEPLEACKPRVDTWEPRTEEFSQATTESLERVARARSTPTASTTDFALLPVLRAVTQSNRPTVFQLLICPEATQPQDRKKPTDVGSGGLLASVAELISGGTATDTDGSTSISTAAEVSIRTLQFSTPDAGEPGNRLTVAFAHHPLTAALDAQIVPERTRGEAVRRAVASRQSTDSTFQLRIEELAELLAGLPPASTWRREGITGSAHPVERINRQVAQYLYDQGIQLGQPVNGRVEGDQPIVLPEAFFPQVFVRYVQESSPPAALAADFGDCAAALAGTTILVRSQDWTETENLDLIDSALRSYHASCDSRVKTVRGPVLREQAANSELESLVEEIHSSETAAYILDLASLDSEAISSCLSTFARELISVLEESADSLDDRSSTRVALLLDSIRPLSVPARNRLLLEHRHDSVGPAEIGLSLLTRLEVQPGEPPSGSHRRLTEQLRHHVHSSICDPAIGGALLSRYAGPPGLPDEQYQQQAAHSTTDHQIAAIGSPRFDFEPQSLDVLPRRGASQTAIESDRPWEVTRRELTADFTQASQTEATSPNQPSLIQIPSEHSLADESETWRPPAEALSEHLTLRDNHIVCLDCGRQHEIPTMEEGGSGLRSALECCGHAIPEADVAELKQPRVPQVEQAVIRDSDYSPEFLQFLKLVYLARAGRLDEQLEYSITESMTALRDAVPVEPSEIQQALDEDEPVLRRADRPHLLYTTTSRARELLDVPWRRGFEWGEGINDLNVSSVHIEGVRQIELFLTHCPWVDRVETYVELTADKSWLDRDLVQQIESEEPPRVDVVAFSEGRPAILAEFERDADHPADLRADQQQMSTVAAAFGAEVLYVVPSRPVGQRILGQLRRSTDELASLPDYSKSTQLKSANQRLAEIEATCVSVVETRKHLLQMRPDEIVESASSVREQVLEWY